MVDSRYAIFDNKRNTLYINSDLMLPKKKGGWTKEWSKEVSEAFKLTYQERLEKYCPEDIREQVQKEIKAHKGCKISEFTGV